MSDKRSSTTARGGRRKVRSKGEAGQTEEPILGGELAADMNADIAPTTSEGDAATPVTSNGHAGSTPIAIEERLNETPGLVHETIASAQTVNEGEPSFRPAPLARSSFVSSQVQVPAQDAYTTSLYFDKTVRAYIGSVLEFPEIKATGASKEAVLEELESKLDGQLQALKRNGELPPEAIFSKRYPEKLELRLSQSLFRKLDLLARHEKTSIENLAIELLSTCAEKRNEPSRGNAIHPQKHSAHPNHANPQSRHGRRGGGRNYQDTLNNRENFMEYVRNLEKGNWRKK